MILIPNCARSDPPCHQPNKLIEADVTIAILVDDIELWLNLAWWELQVDLVDHIHHIFQLFICWRPAKCPHHLNKVKSWTPCQKLLLTWASSSAPIEPPPSLNYDSFYMSLTNNCSCQRGTCRRTRRFLDILSRSPLEASLQPGPVYVLMLYWCVQHYCL